ncbi:hypothetical protein SAV31267_047250 [Streptomyces avermitilis]|uniref:Uncharacterized protein n=1 Tax=Streptomyces avermitilis TaxID=33903 RepID=A0A4D4MSU1_STRAX|nr:hypothetical protein SAV31267_047250 [Streptomyces avermitilis]
MLTTLNTSYTDTCAADLAWTLGREPLPALATLDLELAGAKLQMRLLGASHQVLLEEKRGNCSETVACISGSSTPLPLGVAKRVGDWEYEFAARVEVLSPAPSRAAPRNCWPWSPTTPTAWPASSPAARTRSRHCSPSTTRARCTGVRGTRIRRTASWWRRGRGWGRG